MNTKHTEPVVRAVVIFSAASLLALAMFGAPGCVGAPHSLDQIQTMPQEKWASWLARVELVAKISTKQYVGGDIERGKKAHAFAVGLQFATMQEPDLVKLAKAAGIDDDLARFLILDAKAMIEERGGWPEGERLAELVGTIARGVELGSAPQ